MKNSLFPRKNVDFPLPFKKIHFFLHPYGNMKIDTIKICKAPIGLKLYQKKLWTKRSSKTQRKHPGEAWRPSKNAIFGGAGGPAPRNFPPPPFFFFLPLSLFFFFLSLFSSSSSLLPLLLPSSFFLFSFLPPSSFYSPAPLQMHHRAINKKVSIFMFPYGYLQKMKKPLGIIKVPKKIIDFSVFQI